MNRTQKAVLLCSLSLLSCVSANTFYVIASTNAFCPANNELFCRSLQEYANQPPNTASNVTMLFLDGAHSLSSTFYLHDLDGLTFDSTSPEMSILCSHDGRFVFDGINRISINNVNLVGCYGNVMTLVHHIAMVNTFVHGLSRNSSQQAFNLE